jgi:peptidoglycan biosynthesis protein MviN/MurJ (putative lipid II flippase)
VFGIIPRTNFTLDDTYQTAWILLWFAVGHIFVCGRWFMYRVFYAIKDTVIPFLISLVSLFLTIIFSILFTNLFSHSNDYAILHTQFSLENFLTRGDGPASVGGIALGMSLAYTIEFVLMMILFHKRKMRLDFRLLGKTLGRKFIAGGFMFVLMYLMYKTWNALTYALPVSANEGYFGSTTLNLIVLTSITVVTSFIVYYLLCLLLKVEELSVFRLGGVRIN